jgi:hypothetical protein
MTDLPPAERASLHAASDFDMRYLTARAAFEKGWLASAERSAGREKALREGLEGILAALNWLGNDGHGDQPSTAQRLGTGHILWEAIDDAREALAVSESNDG